MGFRARHTYELVLPDRLKGLTVEVRGRPMGEFFQGREVTWEDDPEISKEEKATKYRALYEEFVEDIVSWDLEDDDGAVEPVTVDALLRADDDILASVVYAWMHRQVKLPAPLDSGSASGEPSEVAQIPMETLSDSQAN